MKKGSLFLPKERCDPFCYGAGNPNPVKKPVNSRNCFGGLSLPAILSFGGHICFENKKRTACKAVWLPAHRLRFINTFLLISFQICCGRKRCSGAVGNGGRQLANRFCAAVSRGKNSGAGGPAVLSGGKISVFIHLHQIPERFAPRNEADRFKQNIRRDFRDVPSENILKRKRSQAAFAGKRSNNSIRKKPDIRLLPQLRKQARFAAKCGRVCDQLDGGSKFLKGYSASCSAEFPPPTTAAALPL